MLSSACKREMQINVFQAWSIVLGNIKLQIVVGPGLIFCLLVKLHGHMCVFQPCLQCKCVANTKTSALVKMKVWSYHSVFH